MLSHPAPIQVKGRVKDVACSWLNLFVTQSCDLPAVPSQLVEDDSLIECLSQSELDQLTASQMAPYSQCIAIILTRVFLSLVKSSALHWE